jgi:RHS repeat-associated protein
MPEGGTTTYVYDTYQGVNEPGQLMMATFANGNNISYAYDSLGRISAEAAYNATFTVGICREFFYDNSTGATGTIPSGITISNPYGRMVEAETDNCTNPITNITDEWFSYDKDGHVTDMWELTPHSGTYYHSHATIAGNGAPLTVQLANPSLYTETYGLDGEGRPATLSSSGTTLVAGTAYNASSQPTYIDLGTGTDQSDYGWDPNTGRMKNWTFQVGNTSETGTLTWNANGTLRQLAIVDGFNSGGSQTCTFGTSTVMGYDDLGRLLTDNCGSVWQQTFSYNDQYDNLTKSGSSSWNPGYNPANNHYSTGANYDNSGNVTSDPSHTYSWDGYNKLSSIDSSSCASNGECITYDAFGRIVETSYNGVYTEIWYTQLGKTVYMHGSTPQYAYWPTPGGGTVEVNGNNVTSYYMHKDWLGNSRVSSVIGNSQVVSDQAYAPYGEVYNKQATGASTPAQMFTGDTQDVIGGIFDTLNRELNASQGRWLSPDPANSGWNRYAYVLNNPLVLVDPLGLSCEDPHDGQPCVVNVSAQPYDTPLIEIEVDPQYFGTINARENQLNVFLRRLAAQNRNPANNGKSPCGHGGGIGVEIGGDVQMGNGMSGNGAVTAIVNGQVGTGLFYDSQTGGSVGNFASGAAVGNGGGPGSPAAIPQQVAPPSALGTFAGGGVSVFATNGSSPNQISGPFEVLSLNFAFGSKGLSVNWATSGSTWMLSISAGPMGAGLGASGVNYTSNTAVQTTINACGGGG